MADPSETLQPGLESPAEYAFAITPHDDNDLANATRGIYVGVAGDLEVIMAKDSAAVVFENVPVGIWQLRIKRVLDTNTTAGSLVGLR